MSKAHAAQGPSWFTRNQEKVLRVTVIGMFFAMLAGGFLVSKWMFDLSNRFEERGQVIDLLAKNLDGSRDQLKDNGITPTAPPASQVVKEVQGEPGAKGDAGAQGAQGPSGQPGPSGSPGPRGEQGPKGDDGAEGAPGAAGQTGPSGVPGADGESIEGPQGPMGPSGPPGPQGEPGADGQDGQDGADGQPGADGKDGTLPPTMTVNHADGSTEHCTLREDGSTYDCTSTPPAGGGETEEPPAGEQVSAYHGDSGGDERPKGPMTMSHLYAIVSERKRFA